MRGLLMRAAGLRPGELRVVLPFFLLYAGVAAYWAVSASAGDALLLSFLRERSLSVEHVVPWTYLAVAAGTGATMAGVDALRRRVARRRLLAGGPLVLGLTVAAFHPLLAIGATSVRFLLLVWLEVVAFVSLTLAFSLAGDRFGSRDAKRLYGFIGGGFCVGLSGGGAAVPWLARELGVGHLLFVAAGLLGMNAAISAWAARGSASRPAARDEPHEAPPLRSLSADRYLRLLAAAVFLGGLIFVVVDFQLKSAASRLAQEQIAAFYGRLYGWAGVAETIVQFVLLRPLIGWAGIMNLQLVFPTLMAAGGAVSIGAPGLGSAAVANFARIVSAETVERPTRELLFLPLAERIRARAQTLIDGPVAACGQAAGATLVLLLGAWTADARALPVAALAAAVLSVVVLVRLRPPYRRLLESAIRNRPLEPADLGRLAREPGAREVLAEMAISGDEGQMRLARAVLERADAVPNQRRPEPALASRLADPSLTPIERCAAAAEAGRRGGEEAGRGLWLLLQSADSALAAVSARAALEIHQRIEWEGPPLAELQARRNAEATALLLLDVARREAAGTDAFRRAVIEDFAKVRVDVLLSLHGLGAGSNALEGIRLDLWSADLSSRAAALELAEELLPRRAVEALAAWADPPPTGVALAPQPATRAALAALDPSLGRLLGDGIEARRAARLRELPLLRELEAPYLAQLLDASSERRLERGETLFRAGDDGDALFLIEDGAISVRSGDREIVTLDRGECLGELSVLDGLPRSADAVCAASCRLLAVEREAFRIIVSERPAAGLSLLRTLERRLRAAIPVFRLKRERPDAQALASPPSEHDSSARRLLLTAAALRQVALFDGLSEADLAAIAALARPCPVFAGETLFKEGECGEHLFLIAAGRVRIEVGSSLLNELGPGEVLGELALISGLARTATARIAEGGLLFAISAADFQRLLRDEPAVLWGLLETVARRLRRFTTDESQSLFGPRR